MQPPEPYKHVILGLIILKYSSETFEEHRANLAFTASDTALRACGFLAKNKNADAKRGFREDLDADNQLAAMIAPCSVKAQGSLRVPP